MEPALTGGRPGRPQLGDQQMQMPPRDPNEHRMGDHPTSPPHRHLKMIHYPMAAQPPPYCALDRYGGRGFRPPGLSDGSETHGIGHDCFFVVPAFLVEQQGRRLARTIPSAPTSGYGRLLDTLILVSRAV